MQRRTKRFVVVLVVAHVVVAILLIAISLVLTDPVDRTRAFWGRSTWLSALAFLLWACLAGYLGLLLPQRRNVAGLGGIIPGASLVATGYTTLSGLLLIAANLADPGGSIARIHLAGQLVLLGPVILIGLGLYALLTSQAATPRAAPIQALPPTQLAGLLRFQEERLPTVSGHHVAGGTDAVSTLRVALRSLRERIEQDLHQLGSLTTRAGYLKLVSNVNALCEEVSMIDLKAPAEGRLAGAVGRANMLCHQVDELSQLFRGSLT